MKNLIQHIIAAWSAHADHAKKPSMAVRRWDGRTPYGVHPLWCGLTLLHETTLPKSLRESGATALLYHDALEDTNVVLPEHLTKRIERLVRGMTFASSQEEEQKVWRRSKEVRLLKLYDKVSNLLDGAWMTPERRERYFSYTLRLAEDVEKNFGSLNIVRIARSLV